MKNLRLVDLLPQPYYQDIYEMALLMQIEQYQIDDLQQAINKAQNNFYAIVADDKGIAIFEEMLGITDGYYLDLEARRFNVIAKLLPPQPITIRSFNEVLQALNINAKISVNDFHVDVNTQTTDEQALHRLNKLLKSYLPANLTFKALNVGSSSTPAPLKRASGQLVAGQLTSKKSEYANEGGTNGAI